MKKHLAKTFWVKMQIKKMSWKIRMHLLGAAAVLVFTKIDFQTITRRLARRDNLCLNNFLDRRAGFRAQILGANCMLRVLRFKNCNGLRIGVSIFGADDNGGGFRNYGGGNLRHFDLNLGFSHDDETLKKSRFTNR